jgi:hypothetical protein
MDNIDPPHPPIYTYMWWWWWWWWTHPPTYICIELDQLEMSKVQNWIN